MSDKSFNLDLYAKVKADVSSAKDEISKLKQSLSNLEIPKGATSGLERTFEKLNEEISNFELLSSKKTASLGDLKKVNKSWEKISSLIGSTILQLDGLPDKAGKIFPKEVAENITKATRVLENYQKKVKEIKKSDAYTSKKAEYANARKDEKAKRNSYESKNKDYTKKQEDFEAKQLRYRNRARSHQSEQKLQNRAAEVKKEIDKKIADNDARLDVFRKAKVIDKSGKASDAYNKEVAKLEADAEKLDLKKLAKEKTDLERSARSRKGVWTKAKKKASKYKTDNPNATKKDATYAALLAAETEAQSKYEEKQKEAEKAKEAYEKAQNEAQSLNAKLENKRNELKEAQGIQADNKRLENKKLKVEAFEGRSQERDKPNIEAKNELDKAQKEASDAKIALQQVGAELDSATKKTAILETELKEMIPKEAAQEWKAFVEIFEKISGIDLSKSSQDVKTLEEALKGYTTSEIEKTPEIVAKMRDAFVQVERPVERVNQVLEETGDKTEELSRAQQEIDHLRESVLSFFSIGNAIQIFKDAVRDAFKTVKELDKAMTETAVVTDFSVSDMWEQLPRYTETANELGTTTLGAYETMTLFYQQGLDTNEVFQVGTETMKMARIAGLEYADATNLMTAALRGFNMELSDTSAQRVNDVYSELAAITAADTNEIARAMTKTASIAHSANMEFETTAAFLSQIIETTRESAETAGTAMKTVIARFQELTKSPGEIGEVDGEIVDANKIETALRTVGVSLRDAQGQFRNLDEVFLELASKWDGLDRNTQRYIATIAAGSRQQSRFLAMMSNYGRTMELVSAANNSAGASQKQYEKTTESLETALDRLTNAWDRFTMGLANNEIIKGAVDTLRALLELVNNLTDALPKGASSLAKIAVALGGMKIGSATFGGVMASLSTMMSKEGKTSGEAFKESFVRSFQKDTLGKKGITKIFEVIRTAGQKSIGYVLNDYESAFGVLNKKTRELRTGFKVLKASSQSAAAGAIVGFGELAVILGGIYLTVKLIKKAYDAWYNSTPEGQLEKAKEVVEETEKAAQEAKTAFDELNDSISGLNSKYETIDKLTRGTVEWKNAVQEVNNEILGLIDKYPELGSFIENKAGVLSIDYNKEVEGKKASDVISNYQSKASSAGMGDLIAKQKVAEIEKDFYYDKQEKKYGTQEFGGGAVTQIGKGKFGNITHDFLKEETEELARLIADGSILNAQEAQNWLSNLNAQKGREGVSSLVTEDGFLELKEFGKQLNQYNAQIDGYKESLKAMVDANFDYVNYTEQQQKLIENFMGPNRVNEIFQEELKALDTKEGKNKLAKLGITDEAGKYQYAAEQTTKKASQAMGKFGSEISKASDFIQKMYSKKDGGFTQENLNQIFKGKDLAGLFENGNLKEDSAQMVREQAEKEWNQLGELQSLYGNKFENFLAEVLDLVEANTESYADAIEKLQSSKVNLQDYSFDDNLASDSLKGMANQIEKIFLTSGPEAAQSLMSTFQEVLGSPDMSKEAKENFVKAFNGLNIDDIDSVNTFVSTINELGITVPGGTNALIDLKDQIIEVAKATKQWDLDKLKSEIKSTEGLAKDIQGREDGDREFTKEQVDAILKNNPALENDFISTGVDEFIYVGDSMNTLVEALNANTSALLGQYADSVTEKADMSRRWQENEQSSTIDSEKTDIQMFEALIGGGQQITSDSIDNVKAAMEKFGMGTNSGRNLDNYGAEQLVAIIKQSFDTYWGANGSTAQQNFTNESQAQKTAIQQRYNSRQSHDLSLDVNRGSTAEEQEKIANALKVQAKQYGVSQAAVENFNKALASGDAEAKKNTAAILANEIELKKQEKAYGKTYKKLEEVKEAYPKVTKSMEGYEEAINSYGEALNLDMTDSSNFDFIAENMNLIQSAMDGNIDSLVRLNELLAQEHNFTISADGNFEAYNGAVDVADEKTQQFIMDQYKAGAYEIVEETVQQDMDYLMPTYDSNGLVNGFERRTAQAGQTIQMLKPLDAPAIKRASGGGKKGGGGGSKKEEKWENSYDQLYNLTEQINEQMRIREKIERRYDAILKARETTTKALKNNTLEEIDALRTQAALQQEMLLSRKKMMEQFLTDNTDMSKYGTYNAEAGVIEIDWGTINSVTDKEEGEKIEKYIGKLEEIQGQIEDTEDALFDIEDRLDEIKTRGKEEYLDLENRIKDAIISARQEEIDKLSAINDSINTTNAKVLDGIQKSVEKMRQDRANEKAEQDLADKQRQLAYLQQDTSGANDLAIMDLQKEIEEGQQSYTDALIDQKITALQEQNDKAAEQRDQQIAILSAQLQRYEESGQIWEEVQNILDSSLNDENSLIHGSVLEEILKKSESWEAMSDLQKMDWLEELENQVAQGMTYLEVSNNQQDIMNEAMKEALDKIANFKPATQSVSSGKSSNSSGGSSGGKTYPTTQNTQPKINGYIVSIDHGNFMGKTLEKAREAASNHMFKVYKKMYGSSRPDYAIRGMANEAVVKAGYRTYKTGGLADFTGPAWLDGTKSKPEIVLNARDTENFIQLKNVLASLLSHGNTNVLTSENSGDSTYDIDINVESIGSDYDVEQIAEKVESMINSKARYRNNNTINLMR